MTDRRSSEPVLSSSPPSGAKPLTNGQTSTATAAAAPSAGAGDSKIDSKADSKQPAALTAALSNSPPARSMSVDGGGKGLKPVKPKHRKINKQHPEFEMTYDMMLGIRTCVGPLNSKPLPALTPEHAQVTTKLDFPGQGSTFTPAHQMRNFVRRCSSSQLIRISYLIRCGDAVVMR